jgi:hypothetical protein
MQRHKKNFFIFKKMCSKFFFLQSEVTKIGIEEFQNGIAAKKTGRLQKKSLKINSIRSF